MSKNSAQPAPPVALYDARIMHERFTPVRHAFCYAMPYFLFNLDRLAAYDGPGLLRINQPGLISFRDRDHGNGSGRPAAIWAREKAVMHNIDAAGPVLLLTLPRMFGYLFNPVSFYFLHDADGRRTGIIHEVQNAHRERHSYIAAVDKGGRLRHETPKRFHVSPFFDMDGGYRFTVRWPGHKMGIGIRLDGPDGPRFAASIAGARIPLTRRKLAGMLLRLPFPTVKVTAGILWQALRLWMKGLPVHRKPAPPEQETSPAGKAGQYKSRPHQAN